MAGVMVVSGASRGIGAAVARLAAARGYAICVNYAQSREAAERLVGEIARGGGKAVAVRADVSRPEEAERLFAETDRALGRVSVLVNNAGIIGRQCRVEAIDQRLLEQLFATNVYGYFYCAREAVRRMSTKLGGPGGVIVNITSAAARHGGLPEEVHYAASKGAIDSFTVGLAKEVGREGVRVNAIRPGLILSDIHQAHGGNEWIQTLAPQVPIGRAGTPEEVAEAVLWLASDAASYTLGAIVDVTGGR